jgi:hypothetical protein
MTGGAVRQNFKVSVVFGDGEASPERLAQLVTTIRQEIRQLEVSTVEFARVAAPQGARGGVIDYTTPAGDPSRLTRIGGVDPDDDGVDHEGERSIS